MTNKLKVSRSFICTPGKSIFLQKIKTRKNELVTRPAHTLRAEYNLRLVRASFNVRCGELREAKQDIAVALDLMLLSSWARPPDATPHAMRALILHVRTIFSELFQKLQHIQPLFWTFLRN